MTFVEARLSEPSGKLIAVATSTWAHTGTQEV